MSKLAKDIAAARGGLLPFAERATNVGGQYYGVARLTFPAGFFIRKDILEAKGVKPPKLYDPEVVEMARKCQDPAKDLWGFGQTLNRSDDGNGFMNHILLDYGGGVWDKDGKPALGTTFRKQNLEALQFAVDTIQKYKIQPPGVMSWTDVHNNEAFIAGKLISTNNGASLYYGLVSRKNPIAEKTQVIQTPGGPAGSFIVAGAYNMGIFNKSKQVELSEDLIRWIEDEKRFDEYMKVPSARPAPCTRRGPTTRTGSRTRTSTACFRTSCAASGSATPGRCQRRRWRCKPSTSCATWAGAWWRVGSARRRR